MTLNQTKQHRNKLIKGNSHQLENYFTYMSLTLEPNCVNELQLMPVPSFRGLPDLLNKSPTFYSIRFKNLIFCCHSYFLDNFREADGFKFHQQRTKDILYSMLNLFISVLFKRINAPHLCWCYRAG